MKLEERLFSVEETAERLGVSKYTISDWIKAGRLKGTKIREILAGEGKRAAGLYRQPTPAAAGPPGSQAHPGGEGVSPCSSELAGGGPNAHDF